MVQTMHCEIPHFLSSPQTHNYRAKRNAFILPGRRGEVLREGIRRSKGQMPTTTATKNRRQVREVFVLQNRGQI
ncbi:hypothetical protein M5D96_007813, partial [Drosophila gunungcola]